MSALKRRAQSQLFQRSGHDRIGSQEMGEVPEEVLVKLLVKLPYSRARLPIPVGIFGIASPNRRRVQMNANDRRESLESHVS